MQGNQKISANRTDPRKIGMLNSDFNKQGNTFAIVNTSGINCIHKVQTYMKPATCPSRDSDTALAVDRNRLFNWVKNE